MTDFDEILASMREGSSVSYTLNDKGHMTNIEFRRGGCYSYVDVLKRDHAYCIVCYGDYKPLVLCGNWYGVCLDQFNPENLFYVSEKVDAGKFEDFDYDQFKKDATEYYSEMDMTEEQREEVAEIISDVGYFDSKQDCYEKLSELFPDDYIGEVFGDWGMVPNPHFLCWMAIIYLAQEKMREDGKWA